MWSGGRNGKMSSKCKYSGVQVPEGEKETKAQKKEMYMYYSEIVKHRLQIIFRFLFASTRILNTYTSSLITVKRSFIR